MSWGAIFPGQGSQSVGMGKFLFENFKSAQHRFEEASDILKLDFKKLCFEGPESELALTENTQPALLLVSTVSHDVVNQNLCISFSIGAGHSIGEYAALVCSKSITFSDALRAVKKRGQAMQKAVPVGDGSMIAILGLADNQVIELCQWAQKESGFTPLEPANFNSPGQVVISGNSKACSWLLDQDLKSIFPDSRAKLIPLKVSAPFHCSMMKKAEDEMRILLQATEFSNPIFNVVQNYQAKVNTEINDIREHLIRQISAPVLWTNCMQYLLKESHTQLIELGTGKVLSGLAKKISADFKVYNLNSMDDLKIIENIKA